jgi:hypothetical protein
MGKKWAIAAFGTLLLLGCSPTPEPAAETPAEPKTDKWADALEIGYSAAVAAQTAETPEEWDAVAENYTSAITLLQQVPEANANHGNVEAKIEEYRNNRSVARDQEKKAETAWLPNDRYTVKEADGVLGETTTVGWRWLRTSEGDQFGCEYGDYCFGMSVVPQSGCAENLYVELSLLAEGDVNVGFTNATTSGVGAGQEAQLTFNGYEDGAEVKSARLAKIVCH